MTISQTDQEKKSLRDLIHVIGFVQCLNYLFVFGWSVYLLYDIYFPSLEAMQYRNGLSADNHMVYGFDRVLGKFGFISSLFGLVGYVQFMRFRTYYLVWIGILGTIPWGLITFLGALLSLPSVGIILMFVLPVTLVLLSQLSQSNVRKMFP